MEAFLRGIGTYFEACALADDAAAAGATGVGVDVFFSVSPRFVAASFFSIVLGLVALPTTGALEDDAAALPVGLNRRQKSRD